VRETAGVATSALALLERVAHATRGGRTGRGSSTGFMGEAAGIATVTLTTLEGIAWARGTTATSGAEGGEITSTIVT